HDLVYLFGLRFRFVHYLKRVVGGPLYQVLLAGAAVRAVWREQRGRNDWELTSHVGAHLTDTGHDFGNDIGKGADIATATATGADTAAATEAAAVARGSREDVPA
ncbi:hypothetical protein ACFWDP_36450, partial [Streptomyces anthocyanicus]